MKAFICALFWILLFLFTVAHLKAQFVPNFDAPLKVTGKIFAVPQERRRSEDWKFFLDPEGDDESIIIEANQDPESVNRLWLNSISCRDILNCKRVEITIRQLED